MPWTPIRTMRRGQRPDFTILNEPRNVYVTRAQRWLTDQLIDLEKDTVIAGWYSHKPGYHDTVAHNDARSGIAKDYSARDPQDRRGPRDKTRAWDWTFRDAQAGDYTSFEKYGDRLMVAYRNSDPRLNGWREYLGRVSTPVTVNGKLTKRVGIDFRHHYLRIPDSTHDWHAHGSESTEHVESFWNKWAFLTVLAGWSLSEWRMSIEETDMDATQDARLFNVERQLDALLGAKDATNLIANVATNTRVTTPNVMARRLDALANVLADVDEQTALRLQVAFDRIEAEADAAAQQRAELRQEITEVPAETVDALVNSSPDEAARAIQAALGPERAQELAEALLALGSS